MGADAQRGIALAGPLERDEAARPAGMGGGDQRVGLGLVVDRPLAEMLGARAECLSQDLVAGPARAGAAIDAGTLGRDRPALARRRSRRA